MQCPEITRRHTMHYQGTMILTRPPGVDIDVWDRATYDERIRIHNMHTDAAINAALQALRNNAAATREQQA